MNGQRPGRRLRAPAAPISVRDIPAIALAGLARLSVQATSGKPLPGTQPAQNPSIDSVISPEAATAAAWPDMSAVVAAAAAPMAAQRRAAVAASLQAAAQQHDDDEVVILDSDNENHNAQVCGREAGLMVCSLRRLGCSAPLRIGLERLALPLASTLLCTSLPIKQRAASGRGAGPSSRPMAAAAQQQQRRRPRPPNAGAGRAAAGSSGGGADIIDLTSDAPPTQDDVQIVRSTVVPRQPTRGAKRPRTLPPPAAAAPGGLPPAFAGLSPTKQRLLAQLYNPPPPPQQPEPEPEGPKCGICMEVGRGGPGRGRVCEGSSAMLHWCHLVSELHSCADCMPEPAVATMQTGRLHS